MWDHSERQGMETDLIDPSGFWRFVFWLVFVLGSLSLLLVWGLAHVPQPDYHGDYRLNYASCTCAILLMTISILMARWLWQIRNPLTDEGPLTALRLVLCAAWIQGAIALLEMVGIALFHH